ncbi:MAG: class I SAM-dependent methyltransferase [Bryobacteraceae bacterium]|nr:class I SAM-dependent methyltransferase [Bryobacteraceae bacterium]
MAAEDNDLKTVELTAIIREIQDRVRARFPLGEAAGIPLPDLMPVVHARDAALGKVAAIGSVNPRRGGAVNASIQAVKRLVSRSLRWFVREQVEFNRASVLCVEALLEALNETKRALAAAAAENGRLREEMQAALDQQSRHVDQAIAAVREETSAVKEEAVHLQDIRKHWAEWRPEWERKLSVNEMQFLRSVADLQTGFSHRAGLMEANLREQMRAQHSDFHGALDRYGLEIQKRLWEDLAKVRTEFDRLIHDELRLLRLRAAAGVPPPAAPSYSAPASAGVPDIDWLHFARRFRGTEEHVRSGQQRYVPVFQSRRHVLDIGCGRGEFLEVMRETGVPARGIDLSEESVVLCRGKGLAAEVADLFDYLSQLPDAGLDGIFCSQVVEHLPPEALPRFLVLAGRKLERNGVIALETPNPECLAIFATHFYIDPTHQRPVPAALLSFYLEEAGFGGIRVERLSPAIDSMPALAELPASVRETFFGGLDYSIMATRL